MKLLAILLVTLAFGMTISCLKKQNLEEDDGPEAPVAEVQKKVIEAWGNDNPLSMLNGEFSSVLTTQTLQEVQTNPLGQKGFNVVSRALNSKGDAYNYSMAIQTEEYINGQTKLTSKQLDFAITNDEARAEAQAVSETQGPRLQQLISERIQPFGSSNPADEIFAVRTLLFALSICQKHETLNVSCHNLESFDGEASAPEAVKQNDNCKPGTNCKIKYKQISFDIVIAAKTEPDNKEKYKFKFIISPDVPYLARVMSYCQKGMVPLSGSSQKIVVNLCQTVNNYRFGQEANH